MSIFCILISIFLPLGATLSIYPIFTLANIDENLMVLREDVDAISSSLNHTEMKKNKDMSKDTNSLIEQDEYDYFAISNNDVESTLFMKSRKAVSVLSMDDIYYINNKYGLKIFTTDTLDELKEKIRNCSSDASSFLIFKQKVESAKNLEEIKTAILLHKAVNG